MMLDVNDRDGPKVPSCILEGNLQGLNNANLYISSTNRVILLHIGESKPNSWFSIPNGYFEVNAEVFLRRGEELNIELSGCYLTYLPIRLQALSSPLGSGMVTVLLESIEPVILKALRAMVGSCMP